MKTFISICTTLLFLLMACHATFADVVEDLVLYLDASDNPAHPKAWRTSAQKAVNCLPQINRWNSKKAKLKFLPSVSSNRM